MHCALAETGTEEAHVSATSDSLTLISIHIHLVELVLYIYRRSKCTFVRSSREDRIDSSRKLILFIFIDMDRKLAVCHVCGVTTKRFADHIAAAHNLLNYKKEKVSYLLTISATNFNNMLENSLN